MPKDELVGKSSLEVKAMLMNTPGSNDSDEQDFESSAYEHKDDSGESEPERKAESPEAYSKRLWQENQEEEAQRRREEAVEQQQASLEYLEKRVQTTGGEEQFAQGFQQAQMSDYTSLRDKYFDAGPLVDIFATEYAQGKIKISPEIMEISNAPQEDSFLEWIVKPSVQKKYGVSTRDIGNIIRAKAEGPALRSRSKELMFPHMMHPKKGRR